MVESQYGKHIIREPRGQIEQDGKIIFDGILVHHDKLGVDSQLLYSAIKKPHVMVDKPHMHDFPHILSFLGSNPLDYYDFDAEIEFYLGGERHIVTKTSLIYIPAGLEHGPFNQLKMERPIFQFDCNMSGKHAGRSVSE